MVNTSGEKSIKNISNENKIVAVYVKAGNEPRWKLPEIADVHCKMTSYGLKI